MADVSDDLREYLERDGSIEILATIHSDGTPFGDLEEKMGASTDTLWRRLEEGVELEVDSPASSSMMSTTRPCATCSRWSGLVSFDTSILTRSPSAGSNSVIRSVIVAVPS